MRSLSESFIDFSQAGSLEPVFVAKIINDNYNIYLTTKDIDVGDPTAQIFNECVISASGTSQKIVPERGLSTIGDVTIVFQDNGFTELLRDIKNNFFDTINNNKVVLYNGYVGMPFSEFTYSTMWVSGLSNDEVNFTLSLSDTNRIVKKSIFEPKAKTTAITSLRFTDASASAPLTLTVESTQGFERVQHTSEWEYQPNLKVGYIKVTGVDRNGESAKEILCYDSKTADTFNIIKRQCFGTALIDFVGLEGINANGDESNELEIEECVYLDLSPPYMAIALLTGELYGQVGERLPDHWNVGVDQTLINIDSFANIGGDLLAQRLQFIDLEKEESKEFINQQVLSPFGMFMSIDQDGELFCRRYSFLSQFSAGGKVLGYDQILNSPTISRNFKTIRNRFIINWEWRPDQDYYARKDVYVDIQSSTTFNVESDTLSLNLRGLKNRDTSSKPALDYVAQSIASRFSNPSIMFSIDCFLGDAIDLEVGDTVTLDLPNHPDYDSLDTLLATFEVQGISWDFIRQTATLDLFSSAGQETRFDQVSGGDVVSIDHTGWTNLSTRTDLWDLDAGTGDLWFKNNASIPNGKWYYDGNIVFKGGRRVYVNQSVFLDSSEGNVTVEPSAIIDGKGRGVAGARGYVGGADAGQEGLLFTDYGFLGTSVKWKWKTRASSYVIQESRSTVDLPFLIKADDINNALPPILYGSGGGRGGDTTLKSGSLLNGGSAVAGGAGLFLSGDNVFVSSTSTIDLSGANNNQGQSTSSGTYTLHAGASGMGYPGAFIVAVKKKSSPLPIIGNEFVCRAGLFTEQRDRQDLERPYSDWRYKYKSNSDHRGFKPAAASNANRDYSSAFSRAIRIISTQTHTPEAGVDVIERALAPVLTLKESINTPRTPNGNISTITINASADPADNGFSYALFEYRNKTLRQWVPITYKTSGEATVEVVSDGTTYEFRATSHNKQGQSGGVSTAEITVANVERSTEISDGGSINPPIDVTVPPIKRLELVNRITNDEWDKFKSPNAEFRWAKLSTTQGGSIIQLNGALDLHLEGYKVRITVGGKIVREELVKDSFYTYTYDKNKKDNGTPVRSFRIDVMAVTTTGYVSAVSGFEVENPAPLAVTNATIEPSRDSVVITYTRPSDFDFVGVRVGGKVYSDTTITLPRLTSRDVDFTLTSVDEFGDGGSVVLNAVNPAPNAPTQINVETSFTTATLRFIADQNDYDVIGVNARYREVGGAWSPVRFIESNQVTFENLPQNTAFEFGLASVDTIGAGNETTILASTKDLQAADVTGLGVWATLTDPADLAFIQANINNNAIQSEKIASITAGKITTGQIDVTVDLGTGVRLDGANGYVQTLNGGYAVTMGAHTINSNTYVLSAADGNNVNFFVDAAGNGKFGQLGLGADGSITSTNFSIAANGDATFGGELSAASGSFEGSVFIDSAAFGDAGIQLDPNAGNARAYIGDGGESFLKYEDGVLSLGDDSALIGYEGYNNQGFIYEHIRGVLWPQFINQTLGTIQIQRETIQYPDPPIHAGTTYFASSTTGNTFASYLAPAAMAYNGISMSKEFRFKFRVSFYLTASSDHGNTWVTVGVGTIDELNFAALQVRLNSDGSLQSRLKHRANAGSILYSGAFNIPNQSYNEFEIRYGSGPSANGIELYCNGALIASRSLVTFSSSAIIEEVMKVNFNRTSTSGLTGVQMGDFKITGST